MKGYSDCEHMHVCSCCGNTWTHRNDPAWTEQQFWAAHTCCVCQMPRTQIDGYTPDIADAWPVLLLLGIALLNGKTRL